MQLAGMIKNFTNRESLRAFQSSFEKLLYSYNEIMGIDTQTPNELPDNFNIDNSDIPPEHLKILTMEKQEYTF